MDRTSSGTATVGSVATLRDTSDPVMLPNDVLPNIFSRLPAPELFALASVSREIQTLTQPLLGDAADSELRACSPLDLQKSLQHLAALLHVAGHHISDQAWTDFLQGVEAICIDPRLVNFLLLSLARDDAALRKRADVVALANSTMSHREINGPETARLICAAGMKQLMSMERLGRVGNAMPNQLSHRRGWKQLAHLFRLFTPKNQVDVLLQLKARNSDGANIRAAFDELLATHVAGLVESGRFMLLHRSLAGEPAKRSAYFGILSDAYTMAASPDQLTYFQQACQQTMQPTGIASEPWRRSGRENCNFLFRALAYEIRTNLTENLKTYSFAIRRELQLFFLTGAEVNDFTKKLNVRMDQGMPLEDAVSLWIDENRNPGSCVIS
jgi:hypothetical protein